jgi:predicted RNA binding protein YcfA (HicA-like mRNA interferase family)
VLVPKFPVLEPKELVQILEKHFGVISTGRGKGSHRVYKRVLHGETYITVIQTNVTEYRVDQTTTILEQLRIPKQEFLKVYNSQKSKGKRKAE